MLTGDAFLRLHEITQFPHQETPSLSLFQQPCLENKHLGTSRCVLMLGTVSSLAGQKEMIQSRGRLVSSPVVDGTDSISPNLQKRRKKQLLSAAGVSRERSTTASSR